eukprot:scaffold211173_cov20-Tisochrysis_lutea.AAC.2
MNPRAAICCTNGFGFRATAKQVRCSMQLREEPCSLPIPSVELATATLLSQHLTCTDTHLQPHSDQPGSFPARGSSSRPYFF